MNFFFSPAGTYNHAMSQQQLRAANHVTGLPYMKSDLSGMGQPNKSPLNDNFGPGPNYNNGGRSQGGPPSPKTKLKMEQQQQQQAAAAKMAGLSSMNNLNNLSHIAQMRMNSIGYNIGMSYNPSPIARPQVAHMWSGSQQTMNILSWLLFSHLYIRSTCSCLL